MSVNITVISRWNLSRIVCSISSRLRRNSSMEASCSSVRSVGFHDYPSLRAEFREDHPVFSDDLMRSSALYQKRAFSFQL